MEKTNEYERLKRKWKGVCLLLMCLIIFVGVLNEHFMADTKIWRMTSIMITLYAAFKIVGIHFSFVCVKEERNVEEIKRNLHATIITQALALPIVWNIEQCYVPKRKRVRKVSFAEGLKFWREKKGLTQEELAEKIGYRQQSIAKWETQRGTSHCDMVSIVADALDIEESDLFHIPC